MSDYKGFVLDSVNKGWVKGWIVFNDNEKVYTAIYKTEEEAKAYTESAGKPFAYSYGSHKPNTDEYILDSYEA